MTQNIIPKGRWTRYEPDASTWHPNDPRRSTIFLQDEQGRDWYQTVAHHPDTRAIPSIATDDTGRVTIVACEAERLFPLNATVYVLDGATYARDDDMVPLFSKAIALDEDGLPTLIDAPPRPVFQITRRQCARALFARQMITGPEMVAMTTTGTPPAMIETIFAPMPEAEQWLARADFAADTYMRDNPLLVFIMTASGSTPADIDDFFREAATL